MGNLDGNETSPRARGVRGLPARRHDRAERGRVLVLDDDPDACELIEALLSTEGFCVETARGVTQALAAVRSFAPHVMLTDVRLPTSDGFSVMDEALRVDPLLSVVLITAEGTVPDAVRALRGGADDYLAKPLDPADLVVVVSRAVEKQRARRGDLLSEGGSGASRSLVGSCPPMRALRADIERVGPSSATVLIRGETGTGKERVAAALHAASSRARKPFVAVHCASLPESLLESELFGHERGAFTGAVARRVGRFEMAHGGTIFLDEIGELSQAIQVKLLRVLQERAFERVGGHETVRVDVRVIAATHRDLAARMAQGEFREDLYYRVNVVEIEVPPLRERSADVALLVEHTLARFARDAGRVPSVVSPDAMRLLTRYDWPGNVRELENVIERALVFSDGHEITVASLVSRLLPHPRSDNGQAPHVPGASFKEIERHAILSTYEACGNNVTRTAGVLKLSPRTIQYRLREYRGDVGRRIPRP